MGDAFVGMPYLEVLHGRLCDAFVEMPYLEVLHGRLCDAFVEIQHKSPQLLVPLGRLVHEHLHRRVAGVDFWKDDWGRMVGEGGDAFAWGP